MHLLASYFRESPVPPLICHACSREVQTSGSLNLPTLETQKTMGGCERNFFRLFYRNRSKYFTSLSYIACHQIGIRKVVNSQFFIWVKYPRFFKYLDRLFDFMIVS